MKKALIVLIVAALAVWLAVTKPWQEKRYNSTPAGQEAKKTDAHVQQAFDWTPPDKWDAKEFLGETPNPKVIYEGMIGMSHAEGKKMVKDFKDAGAKEVDFINVHRSVRTGDDPEGLVLVLPENPTQRAAIFTLAGGYYKRLGKTAPPDVHQKYLYIGYGRWTPEKEEPGFLPG